METMLATTLFSLLANTLASSLYDPLTKLMGLNFLKSLTPFFFGINTWEVGFILLIKEACLKDSLIKSIISCFTKSLQCYQKVIVIPLGLGALSPLKQNKVENTYFLEIGTSKFLQAALSK